MFIKTASILTSLLCYGVNTNVQSKVCVLYYIYVVFLLGYVGKQVGEEAVTLNPLCAESHQWYVCNLFFNTVFTIFLTAFFLCGFSITV